PEAPTYPPSYQVKLPTNWSQLIGVPMYYDHRRVIATAISRLRAKIEYRPLIFGLMPDVFTLSQLQQSVEALSGVPLHKQNFRRLLDAQNLVMETGQSSSAQRGRPAKLYRFRHDIELQSLLMDSKLPKRKQHQFHKPSYTDAKYSYQSEIILVHFINLHPFLARLCTLRYIYAHFQFN